MSKIDEQLMNFFSPDQLLEAYKNYKQQKTDYFDTRIISISMGADGVSFEAVVSLVLRHLVFTRSRERRIRLQGAILCPNFCSKKGHGANRMTLPLKHSKANWIAT